MTVFWKQVLDEVRVKIILISSSHWWRFLTSNICYFILPTGAQILALLCIKSKLYQHWGAPQGHKNHIESRSPSSASTNFCTETSVKLMQNLACTDSYEQGARALYGLLAVFNCWSGLQISGLVCCVECPTTQSFAVISAFMIDISCGVIFVKPCAQCNR